MPLLCDVRVAGVVNSWKVFARDQASKCLGRRADECDWRGDSREERGTKYGQGNLDVESKQTALRGTKVRRSPGKRREIYDLKERTNT
jgi:hypothetical protein